MSDEQEMFAKIIYVAVAVFVISQVVSVEPSAFSDIPVNAMVAALLLLIPTGAFFVLRQASAF
jgi:hypothetical protein